MGSNCTIRAMLTQQTRALYSALVLTILATTSAVSSGQPASTLRIVVIQGEDAVNIVQQKTAVSPIVEVRDRNDLPVAGATVSFTIGSKSATFAGGSQVMTITTNAAGRAAAAVTPLSSGAVPIQVAATFQGQTVSAVITQTNVMTAAQAAGATAASNAASAGGMSSGGVSGQTLAIIGVAGAAGAGAIVATSRGGSAPSVAGVTAEPNVALQGATAIRFTSQGAADEDASYLWQFGDGSSSTERTPTHVYASAGSFNVTLTVSNDKGSSTGTTSVTVRSIGGNWIRTTPIRPTSVLAWSTITLTQSGTALAGTINLFAVTRPPGSQDNICPISGAARTGSSQADISRPACPVLIASGTQVIPGETFTLNFAPDLNSFTAFVLGEADAFTWVRQ
jgi:PKD repeat protein